jgi:putative Mg2+ transporter-C (MgtC) family protein
MDIWDIFLRLFMAIALGGIIGIERETSRKPAGFRTNILICISSAMMMILARLISGGNEAGGDSMRLAAGVITGVGFLGAGTIIQSRGTIHGLTTASTIWAVAGLGLVIGAGYYVFAALFTGLVVLTLVLFRKIERVLLEKAEKKHGSRV